MSQNTLNVRLQQKFASIGDWIAVKTKTPLKGEVCKFQISSATELANAIENLSVPTALSSVTTFPIHLTKTGDGQKTLAQLPWDMSLASDVYPWAKSATPPIPNVELTTQDDSVVILSGQGDIGGVSINAAHATKGPTSGYISGNTNTTVTGGGATSNSTSIKIPQLTVDKYGHVNAAADETITITIPPNEVPHTHKVTAAGTISRPTFTGNQSTTSTSDSTNIVKVGSESHEHEVSSKGTVTISTGTVSASTPSNYTPEGNVSLNDYTPEGTITSGTITVTPDTTSVKSIATTGNLPSFYGTESSGNLTLSWDAGSLPTSSSITVVSGIKSTTTSQFTFKGTAKALLGSFTGTPVYLNATYEGDSMTTGTPTATISVPSTDHTHTVTSTGTVSQPTFTGTEVTSEDADY